VLPECAEGLLAKRGETGIGHGTGAVGRSRRLGLKLRDDPGRTGREDGDAVAKIKRLLDVVRHQEHGSWFGQECAGQPLWAARYPDGAL
jgi:hypothetical protein